MKVIGIDPGYDRLGVAVMEYQDGKETVIYSECVLTDASLPLNDRLHFLGQRFTTILTEHQPDAIGIETLFFNKNQKTAIGVAEARGILIFLAQEANATIYEFGPQEIKIATTGYGKSDKGAVIDMVKRLATGVPEDAHDDEYDAIAVGITCLAQYGRGR